MICDLTLLIVTVTGVGLFFLQPEKKVATKKKLSNRGMDLLVSMFFVFCRRRYANIKLIFGSLEN